MKQPYLILIPLLFLIACKERKVENGIVIEGQLMNIPDGKLYLTEAHKWQTPLDSTECRDGHFVFRIKADSSFAPYMASIAYPDSSLKEGRMNQFLYRNYTLGKDSMTHSASAFFLEKGYTRIEGDNTKRPFLRVFAGRETDLMYRMMPTAFGQLNNKDSATRLQRLGYYKTEVKKHPYSYFLLRNIYDAKNDYLEEEITEILGLFDADVQSSKLGNDFRTYLRNRTDLNNPSPNLLLLNATGQRVYIIDPNARLTMLVFWASWCGPCRMEIPVLKEVQKAYKDKGLKIVSISIDEKKEAWMNALSREKMAWSQLLVDKNKIEEVAQQFGISAIPLVVFTDKSGKEVKRFVGYQEDRKKLYETVIKKYMD